MQTPRPTRRIYNFISPERNGTRFIQGKNGFHGLDTGLGTQLQMGPRIAICPSRHLILQTGHMVGLGNRVGRNTGVGVGVTAAGLQSDGHVPTAIVHGASGHMFDGSLHGGQYASCSASPGSQRLFPHSDGGSNTGVGLPPARHEMVCGVWVQPHRPSGWRVQSEYL